MESNRRKPDQRLAITQRQVWVMLVATVLLMVLLSVIFLQERRKEWQLRIEQASHRLALAQEIVSRDFDRVRADLHFVAGLPEIEAAGKADGVTLEAAAGVFREFVTSQKTYSQVRLLGRNGMEIARVDWDGETATTTDSSNLQDKSDRYYVEDSLDLEQGQIFTSEFDLNLENGRIETPLRPVIRFVTPVSQSGRTGNLLIFNYEGTSLLTELSAISLPGSTYLIRNDGQFLLGPNSNSEWGWLLEHETNFRSLYSDVNLADMLLDNEPVSSSAGLFLAKEIQFSPDGMTTSEEHSSIFCVAHIDKASAFQSSGKLLFRLLLVGGFMLVPLALITHFWVAAIDRRELQNRRIADSEKRLRQLSEQLVSLQEEERKNLSREIHDSLGQQATAINIDLRMLKAKLPESPELHRLIGESDQLLKSLHGFATSVRPAELDDLGLEVAIESHVSEFSARTGIESDLSVQLGDSRVDSAVATHVFRMVQESLNNIAKHSGATIASVQLTLDAVTNELQLFVTDDGIGMDGNQVVDESTSISSKRLGMIGMRERVDLLNGEMELSSVEGHGTKLEIRIPMPIDTDENKVKK